MNPRHMNDLAKRLRGMANDPNVDFCAATLNQAADRIGRLEAGLRECVQYHVKAAADCRAIAAVNQDNSLGSDCLTHAIDHDIAAEDIGEIARAALDKDDGK